MSPGNPELSISAVWRPMDLFVFAVVVLRRSTSSKTRACFRVLFLELSTTHLKMNFLMMFV